MTERPMRADARRNRDRIIAVAAKAFAEHGPDAYLEDIARDSGVGIGTLYRHFPTRDALFVAVHRAEITRIAERAGELLGQHPPDGALELWLGEFLGFMQAKQGMAEVFRSVMSTGDNPFLDLRAAVADAANRLLTAAQEDGARPPLDAFDLLTMVHGISLATDDPDQAQRLLRLITDSLAGTGSAPAGSPGERPGMS
jgi:AcrR family transcriptional regulator